MRTANLNALYSRSSPTHRLACRTSCAACYCYVYFTDETQVDHCSDLLCTACVATPNAPTTTLSLFCGGCGDTLCPVQGHTTGAQRNAELCTDCYNAAHPYKQAQLIKPAHVHGSCAICLAEHTLQSSVQLACEHLFHHHCIAQWLRKCDTCPLCRQNVCQIN
jgi:hypothetical protein